MKLFMDETYTHGATHGAQIRCYPYLRYILERRVLVPQAVGR